MDDLISKNPRRHIKEPNLVPVIDMFTVVIFFLILSTSFFSFTKITLPPSKVSVNTDPIAPPPLGAKLLVKKTSEKIRLMLTWTGSSPGQELETVSVDQVVKTASKLVSRFKEKFPKERTIQVGLTSETPYQALIDTMDGVRESLPDIVLISPEEASVRVEGAGETS